MIQGSIKCNGKRGLILKRHRNQVSGTGKGSRSASASCCTHTASSKSREPTSAMAVIEPGLGSSVDGKGEEGIDGSLERAGTPLHLGE